MKYLGVLFFFVLASWTWRVVHSTSPIPFETHASIQDRLSEMILEAVRAKKPDSSEVQIVKIWTETLGPGKLKAHFSYSFRENSDQTGSVWSLVDGEGLLKAESDNKWVLSDVLVTGDNVVFEREMVVMSDGNPQKPVESSSESNSDPMPPQGPTESQAPTSK